MREVSGTVSKTTNFENDRYMSFYLLHLCVPVILKTHVKIKMSLLSEMLEF